MSDDLTINVDVPSSPSANTADIRANWLVIERRLEALEGGTSDVDFLPLTGGELTGPLLVSAGTIGSPGLQFGVADGTGIWRSPGNIIALSLLGAFEVAFTPGLTQFYTNVSLLNNRIQQMADATAPGDALNQRTGDARYAPVAVVEDVAALRAEVDALLQRLADRVDLGLPVGAAMRPTLHPRQSP